MGTIQTPKKGMSLIESMVAILILAIVVIGGSSFFVYGRSWISLQGRYRAAIQLAAQKLEQLKADNYYEIEEGETQESVSLGDSSCIRSVQTETKDGGLYKKLQVTVRWNQMGKERNVSLVSYIAPK